MSLFFVEHWFSNGIILVDQLFNPDGFPFTYDEYLSCYGIAVTPGEYAKVFGAIPSEVCALYKQQPRLNNTQLPTLTPIHSPAGKICFSSYKTNKSVTMPYVMSDWNRLVDNLQWKNVWRIPDRYLIINKVK